MQSITISGHLGHDAEWRTDATGSYGRFSLAARNRKAKGAAEDPPPTWYTVYYSQEALTPYLQKGTMIIVQGELSADVYQGRDGAYRPALRVSARSIELLPKGDRQPAAPSAPAAPQAQPASQPAAPPSIEYPDDLPF